MQSSGLIHYINMTNNKLEKIVINTGLGRLSSQPNFEERILPEITKEISIITGQKPMNRPATKSIAGFKLRQGTIVGLKVTLRSKKMQDFFSKVLNVILPRVRDFRGIDLKSIDQNGNLTIGIKECSVFPEITPETSKVNFGIEITAVPIIKKRDQALELYKKLGVPFKKK